MERKWIFIIIFLVILGVISLALSSLVSLFSPLDVPVSGNVALISINGPITREGDGFFEESVSSEEVVGFIEMADKNPSIKAIMLDINSGGGGTVASSEIANAIKKTDKMTVAVVHDAAASGAYWIASSTDYIFANELSVVGSVGVIASYLEFTNLLQNYGVNYRRLVAGKYKDLGAPFRNLTPEEEGILQEQLDLIHSYFLDDIARNRNLTPEQKEEISTAGIYLGMQAKRLNLIDEFGGNEEALAFIEKKLGIKASLAEYKKKKTIFDVLQKVAGKQSFFVGMGIGNAMLDKSLDNSLNIRI